MTRVFPTSRKRLLAAGAILTIAAAFGIVPWRLVAQEPDRPSLASETAASTADPADGAKLPGKIYGWAWLEGTNEFGAPGEYRGVIAIDPNTGNWAKLGNLGHSLRLSPDGTQLAFDNSPRSRLPRADGPAPDDVLYAELKDFYRQDPIVLLQ